MITTDPVRAYRHTSRTIRRHHRYGYTAAELPDLRAALWQAVADRDPGLARLLVTEDLLLARIGYRKRRGRGHRWLDARLGAVRAAILTHAARA